MKRTMMYPATLALLTLMSLPALSGIHEYALPPEIIPEFVMPRIETPPNIDGVVNADEWRGATAISGVAQWQDDSLCARPTTFFLAWDPDRLYVACRTYVRPGYKPNIPAGRSPGMAYIWDDGLELTFTPLGANVPSENLNNSYRWFLNCLGFTGDCSRYALGQAFKSWNPQFDIHVRLTEVGTAPNGGRWWELEMSAAPEDFELNGQHQAGDQWRMNLGFNHMPSFRQDRIPCNGGYREPFGHTLFTLVEDVPAVKMTMDSLNNLVTDGTASIKINVYNPADTEASVSLNLNVADAIKRQETIAIGPGKTSGFMLNQKLPDSVKEGRLFTEIRQGDALLFRYTSLFEVGSGLELLQPAAPMDPNRFTFQARYNPVRSLLYVKGDTYSLDDPDQAKALYYRIQPENGGDAIAEGAITQTAEYFLQDMIELAPPPPGKYIVEATMELQDGALLGPMTDSFEKKDEANVFARWWGKKEGNAERMIPPYTALERNGNAVACLGRQYELNALGLPNAIRSREEAVSAAPARIVVVTAGKETVVAAGALNVTDIKDWRVSFQGKAKGAGVAFEANGWVEQDGLVYVDLTYGPDGKTPVIIDSLRIEYPLSEMDADALGCIGPGGNFSSRTTMLLPDGQDGQLWSTLNTGISGSGMTLGSFYPTVWIASERRGLLWWADNDRGWIQDHAVPAHEVVRKGGAVVLINHIVARPSKLDTQRTVAFSYMALPFKPMVKGWRMTQSTEDGTFHVPFRDLRKDSKTGQKVFQNPGGGLLHVNWIHPESRYPEEWRALWKQQKTEGFDRYAAADDHVRNHQWRDPYAARAGCNFTHMSFQIVGYGRKSLEDDAYAYFGSEWEWGGNDTWNETYTDYAMTLFAPAFKDGGVRSTYWDLAMPILYDDPLSGLAYRLPDGRIQRGYNGWNVRRFMMRLNALQADAGLVPGGNGFHSTNSYLTVAMPWVDAVLDGERDWDLDTSEADWVDNMPVERMRAMSSPHMWGVPLCWMANMHSKARGKVDAHKRIQAMWIWMHDAWRNPYISQLPVMPQSVLDWGVNSEDTIYHPYWRNPYVTSEDEHVLISLWQLPDRVMLGVYNYNREQVKDVALKVDLDALNLLPQLPWQEFVGLRDLWTSHDTAPASTLDFHKATLSVQALQPHTLRLIGIRRY